MKVWPRASSWRTDRRRGEAAPEGSSRAPAADGRALITDKERRFFNTFGYLVVRGLLRHDLTWIEHEFHAVFRDQGAEHTGERRTMVVQFIDQRERLCTLLDHPGVASLLSELLGPDFNYLGSDGNYYTGDTPWHCDGGHQHGPYVKLAMYLDPLTRDTGALRVMPGTHRFLDWAARSGAYQSVEAWGVAGCEVPAVALECQPGDVVVFNHNLMHSSWGGGARRRMFTMNCSPAARTEEELQELRDEIGRGALYHLERTHSDLMRGTASDARMVHLRQVMENESHLSVLTEVRKAEGHAALRS